jgi:lambda repressor-like predicted transcriptional regulator
VTHPDPINEVARRFAVNVREVIGEASIRSVATKADIDHNTLRRVLAGDVWPDMIVIAKLERAFKQDLWPGRVD